MILESVVRVRVLEIKQKSYEKDYNDSYGYWYDKLRNVTR